MKKLQESHPFVGNCVGVLKKAKEKLLGKRKKQEPAEEEKKDMPLEGKDVAMSLESQEKHSRSVR